jgi:hypothetical protein
MDEKKTREHIQRHAGDAEAEAAARIHYAGDTSELTIQSRWRDVGGRPMIVHAEPVD